MKHSGIRYKFTGQVETLAFNLEMPEQLGGKQEISEVYAQFRDRSTKPHTKLLLNASEVTALAVKDEDQIAGYNEALHAIDHKRERDAANREIKLMLEHVSY